MIRWAWKGGAKESTWGPRPCPWFAQSSSPSSAWSSRTTPWISSPSWSSCPHAHTESAPPPLLPLMLGQVCGLSSPASLLRRTTASSPLPLALFAAHHSIRSRTDCSLNSQAWAKLALLRSGIQMGRIWCYNNFMNPEALINYNLLVPQHSCYGPGWLCSKSQSDGLCP